MHALVREHFVNKSKIAVTQGRKTRTGISMRLGMRVEGWPSADQVRTIKHGGGTAEDINSIQEVHPASLPARNHSCVLRKPFPFNLIVASLIRSHNPDFRMSFGQLNHSREAIRCDPIICGYYFAVLAARRN